MRKHIVCVIHGMLAMNPTGVRKLDGPIETLKKVSQQYQYFKQPGQDPIRSESGRLSSLRSRESGRILQ